MSKSSLNRFSPPERSCGSRASTGPRSSSARSTTPQELQIDKQITWEDHKERDNRTETDRRDSSEESDLEFKNVKKRTIQLKLLFDGYEQGESVEPDVQRLEELSTVTTFKLSGEVVVRPHHCLVAWGAQRDGMPPFPCVIESLSTTYTMWDTNGRPLRAICTVTLKEAERMTLKPRPIRKYEVKERPPDWDRVLGRPR